MSDDKCAVKGCKSRDVQISWLGKPLCGRCWDKFADRPVSKLREALGMKPDRDLTKTTGSASLPPAEEKGKQDGADASVDHTAP